MDISGISSLSRLYSTQKTGSVSVPTKNDRDGDNDSSRVSGKGGGAFMQDVMQSLQSLGLNFSGANANGTPSASSVDSGQSTSSSPSTSNVGPALHTFLHDLHQALHQSGSTQQQASATDTDGDNDNSGSSTSGVQNGYSNFASNLQGLIGSLNNTSGTNGTNNTLQTDFSNLVNALGGSSSSSTPTLQDFLKQMTGNVGNNSSSQNGIGSILSIKA
ncbi:MAG TPA: hypothetical protein VIE65_02040 [Methylobacter sp.]|jgi:hypothetical protein